jgi:hypothetical protein
MVLGSSTNSNGSNSGSFTFRDTVSRQTSTTIPTVRLVWGRFESANAPNAEAASLEYNGVYRYDVRQIRSMLRCLYPRRHHRALERVDNYNRAIDRLHTQYTICNLHTTSSIHYYTLQTIYLADEGSAAKSVKCSDQSNGGQSRQDA